MKKVRAVLFFTSLLPMAWLLYSALTDALGANPIERIIGFSGDWALNFLLLTLSVTPIRIIFNPPGIIRYRRMLGLFTYFYGLVHVGGYVVLDQFFHWPAIFADVLKRPYITVGLTSFTMLPMLAITSTRGWRIKLGRHWRRLHKLVYPTAILACFHYLMMVKADWRTPAGYGGILALLLAVRLWKKFN